MKKLYFIFLAVMFGVVAIGFAGCSSDSEDGGSTSNESSDYIEVSINGKTYRKYVKGIYASTPTDRYGLYRTSSTEDIFSKEGFSVFYSLTHYEDMGELLESSLGSYDVITTTDYVDDADNLSLWLDYEDDSDYYEIKSGKHKVTSIRAKEVETQFGTYDGVVIEGTFDLVMTAEYYTSDSQCKISGKYRMTVY